MNLTQSQINTYKEIGFLIVEDLFTAKEVKTLKNGIDKITNRDTPNIIREKNGEIRSVFAPHNFREEFSWLYKQNRVLEPVKQLLNNISIYLYQYKLNNKKAFQGGVWEWHQDFPFWNLDDGVKEPNMLSVMILLQDTNQAQGPLMFIPESHKNGVADFHPKEHLKGENIKLENSLNGDLKFTVKRDLIKKMVDKNGMKPGIGSIGTTIFFHPNVYHGSNSNISPYDRNTAILTYNATSNLPEDKKENNRPDYICLRDFNPIQIDTRTLSEIAK